MECPSAFQNTGSNAKRGYNDLRYCDKMLGTLVNCTLENTSAIISAHIGDSVLTTLYANPAFCDNYATSLGERANVYLPRDLISMIRFGDQKKVIEAVEHMLEKNIQVHKMYVYMLANINASSDKYGRYPYIRVNLTIALSTVKGLIVMEGRWQKEGQFKTGHCRYRKGESFASQFTHTLGVLSSNGCLEDALEQSGFAHQFAIMAGRRQATFTNQNSFE